jgi:hypothetical protein
LPGVRRGRDQAQTLIRTRVQPARAGAPDRAYPVQAEGPPLALAVAGQVMRALDPGRWPQAPGGRAGSPAMGTCRQMLHPPSSHAAAEHQSPGGRFPAGQGGQVPGRIRIPGRLSWPAEGLAGQCVADWFHCSRADLRQAAGAASPRQAAGAGSPRQATAGSPPGTPAARLAEPTTPAADLPPGLTAVAARSGHQAERLAAPGGAGSPRTRTVGGRARVADRVCWRAVRAGQHPAQGWGHIAAASVPLCRTAGPPGGPQRGREGRPPQPAQPAVAHLGRPAADRTDSPA